MRARKASNTAQFAAFNRALANLAPEVPGFADPIAAQLLAPAWRRQVDRAARRLPASPYPFWAPRGRPRPNAADGLAVGRRDDVPRARRCRPDNGRYSRDLRPGQPARAHLSQENALVARPAAVAPVVRRDDRRAEAFVLRARGIRRIGSFRRLGGARGFGHRRLETRSIFAGGCLVSPTIRPTAGSDATGSGRSCLLCAN